MSKILTENNLKVRGTEKTTGTRREGKTGGKKEEHRYRIEEDENSIYEYDLGCFEGKQK